MSCSRERLPVQYKRKGEIITDNDIRTSLKRLVSVITATPAIRAVGRSGGDRPLPQPVQGDIDLFVYCTDIPNSGERRAWLAGLSADIDGVEIDALAGGNWGIADSFGLNGVETWLMYFTVEQLWAEIRDTLSGRSVERKDNYYYPVGRLAMFRSMESLYDPDGLLHDVSDAITQYPTDLLTAQLAHHLPLMNDEEDFGRAVDRRDVLFYHFVFDLALDHFLQALFALNRTYFPSRKRSLQYISDFNMKPANVENRLLRAIELGATAGTIAESYRIWQDLTRDLSDLVAAAGGR